MLFSFSLTPFSLEPYVGGRGSAPGGNFFAAWPRGRGAWCLPHRYRHSMQEFKGTHEGRPYIRRRSEIDATGAVARAEPALSKAKGCWQHVHPTAPSLVPRHSPTSSIGGFFWKDETIFRRAGRDPRARREPRRNTTWPSWPCSITDGTPVPRNLRATQRFQWLVVPESGVKKSILAQVRA
jgi:hypothetical protein